MADDAVPPPEAHPVLDHARLETLDLEQALVDVELANARVVDLTGRVTSMSGDLLRLRAEVGNLQLVLRQERFEADELRRSLAREQGVAEELRGQVAGLAAELAAVHGSRSFRLAQRVSAVRARWAPR